MNVCHKLNRYTSCRTLHTILKCVLFWNKVYKGFIVFRMGNLSILNLLWFHDTKEKKCSQEKGGSWGAESISCPQMGAQDRPSICRRRKLALRNGTEGNYSTQRLLSCWRKLAGKLTVSIKRWRQVRACVEPQQTDSSPLFSTHWRWFGLKAWQEALGCQATLSCWENEQVKCAQG